jgi:hypothetical protein
MKQQVVALIAQQGLTASYSSTKAKMYIKGRGARRVKDLVKSTFANLPFGLVDQAS